MEVKSGSVKRENVYILDKGDRIEQWNGKSSHPLEKVKAAELARCWVDERGDSSFRTHSVLILNHQLRSSYLAEGKATLTVFDDAAGDSTFFVHLGVTASSLPIHFPPYSPAATPAISIAQAYSLSPPPDSSTSAATSLPLPNKFHPSLVTSSSSPSSSSTSLLIITISRSPYYIWVSSSLKSGSEESRKAMNEGLKILSGLVEKGRASEGRTVVRVVEGSEGDEFWEAVGGKGI